MPRSMSLWCASSDCLARKNWPWGAIASGGICVLNDDVVRTLDVPVEIIKTAVAEQQRELTRRSANSVMIFLRPMFTAARSSWWTMGWLLVLP